MQKNELLQDAIGLIDDDLIMDAKAESVKKAGIVYWLPKIAVAAACAALFIGGWLLLPKAPPSDPQTPVLNNPEVSQPTSTQTLLPQPTLPQPTASQPIPTQPVPTQPVEPNLFKLRLEQEGFKAFSVIYRNVKKSAASVFWNQTDLALIDHMQSTPLVLSGASAVKVESLISQRYVAYISNTGAPIFYDTVEGVSVNLQQRILGDTSPLLEELSNLAEQAANELFPGMLNTKANREYLRAYLHAHVNGLPTPSLEDWDVDTSFMSHLDEYKYIKDQQRPTVFYQMCWDVRREACTRAGSLMVQPYRIKFLSIDAYGGKCIIEIRDLSNTAKSVQVYDIVTDTLRCNLRSGMWNGSYVRYSPDGKLFTVAYEYVGGSGSGAVMDPDYTQRYEYRDSIFNFHAYHGEKIHVVNMETGWQNKIWNTAASEAFLSDSGKVCYFKQLPVECAGKDFTLFSGDWFDRLTLFNRDTDLWVFCTPLDSNPYGKKTILQGNFVRFLADETIAVMERNGQYYAYLLGENEMSVDEIKALMIQRIETQYERYYYGQDVTEQLRSGSIVVAPNERLNIFCKGGILYKQDMFSGESAQKIADADQFLLNGSGTYAYTYVNGSDHVMCYNVLTSESCAIALDPQLYSQMKNTKNAVFRMVYNDTENTLTFSFYLEKNVIQSSPKDFFGLLAKLGGGSYYENGQPAGVKHFTGYQVSEDVMDEFRQSAYDYDHIYGIKHPELYYPKSFPMDIKAAQLFQVLGIAPPEGFLYVDGTQIVLYDIGDETLTLNFYDTYLGLYDDSKLKYERGFWLEYKKGTKTYSYGFTDYYGPGE